MAIDAVAFLPPLAPLDPAAMRPAVSTESAAATGFPQWFEQQLTQVNGQLQQADTQLQQLATGQAQNLHQVMLGLEEARLSFQLMVQVRNRVLEAYQDVLRMQI